LLLFSLTCAPVLVDPASTHVRSYIIRDHPELAGSERQTLEVIPGSCDGLLIVSRRVGAEVPGNDPPPFDVRAAGDGAIDVRSSNMRASS